jgi:hypothetical protein
VTGWVTPDVDDASMHLFPSCSAEIYLSGIEHSSQENDMSKDQRTKAKRKPRNTEFLKKLREETLQIIKGGKDCKPSLEFMDDECSSLLKYLNVQIERTYNAAPSRVARVNAKNLYKLKRKPTEARKRLGTLQRDFSGGWEDISEDHLEFAIWEQFQSKDFEFCCSIQTYQMPLKSKNNDKGWGRIDLVGVTADERLPVVIELKKENADDTLHRMLLEAFAYAIAVRKAWNDGGRQLAMEWCGIHAIEDRILERVPIICVAPRGFWNRRRGLVEGTNEHRVPKSAWEPFGELVRAMGIRGFPASFVQFDYGVEESGKLKIERVERVELPIDRGK